jgi:hypothetical protein
LDSESPYIQSVVKCVKEIVENIKAEEKKHEKHEEEVKSGSGPTKSHHAAGSFCVGLVIGLVVSVFFNANIV